MRLIDRRIGIINRIADVTNQNDITHNIVQRVNGRNIFNINNMNIRNLAQRVARRQTLLNIIYINNDDLICIGRNNCWVLRKNSESKYMLYKERLINNLEGNIVIKKVVPLNNGKFLVEIQLPKEKTRNRTFGGLKFVQKNIKEKLRYLFFNMNYEEMFHSDVSLKVETRINLDEKYIYINDLNNLFLMNQSDGQIINIIEINILGNIICLNNNNSIIIQEKEDNKISEYKIINNEFVKCDTLINNNKISLLAGFDDIDTTLVTQYGNNSILFFK